MDEKKSIDELLAEENQKFDARLEAEAKAGERRIPKPEKKVTKPKVQGKRVGDVAHVHYFEEEFDIVERPCLMVEHFAGEKLYINEKEFFGTVIVPQCVSNYLSSMESNLRISERSVYQDRGGRRFHGELKG